MTKDTTSRDLADGYCGLPQGGAGLRAGGSETRDHLRGAVVALTRVITQHGLQEDGGTCLTPAQHAGVAAQLRAVAESLTCDRVGLHPNGEEWYAEFGEGDAQALLVFAHTSSSQQGRYRWYIIKYTAHYDWVWLAEWAVDTQSVLVVD